MNSSINTKRIALAGLFTAAALIIRFVEVPIFPAAPYLKFDPSGIVCLIAALAFGPQLGAGVTILSWVPDMFLDPFGALMGVLNTLCLVIPSALIYDRSGRTRAGSVAGMAVGAILAIIASCAANLVITPLYSAVSVGQVVAMIIPILLPFNALKMATTVVAGQVLLSPCMNVLTAQTGAPHDGNLSHA